MGLTQWVSVSEVLSVVVVACGAWQLFHAAIRSHVCVEGKVELSFRSVLVVQDVGRPRLERATGRGLWEHGGRHCRGLLIAGHWRGLTVIEEVAPGRLGSSVFGFGLGTGRVVVHGKGGSVHVRQKSFQVDVDEDNADGCDGDNDDDDDDDRG